MLMKLLIIVFTFYLMWRENLLLEISYNNTVRLHKLTLTITLAQGIHLKKARVIWLRKSCSSLGWKAALIIITLNLVWSLRYIVQTTCRQKLTPWSVWERQEQCNSYCFNFIVRPNTCLNKVWNTYLTKHLPLRAILEFLCSPIIPLHVTLSPYWEQCLEYFCLLLFSSASPVFSYRFLDYHHFS